MLRNERILLVDDDQSLLDSSKRNLRRYFDVETALGPKEGLKVIAEREPFAVIVSDLRMPKMDGIEYLSWARKITPDSVRMILTGNADLETAIQAVNEGRIFRFMTKPCPIETLVNVLRLGIEQYRLITAEKELLEKTLKGSIRMLTDLLAMINPEAFGRSARTVKYACEVARQMGVEELWKIETAALLSQVGCVALPEETLKKRYSGDDLSSEEIRQFRSHPKIASDLLSHIPRLQEVAKIIEYQEKHYNGSGLPDDSSESADIPVGSRILKAVLDFDLLETRGLSRTAAMEEMKAQPGKYDPEVLDSLEKVLGVEKRFVAREVGLRDLRIRMILAEDVQTVGGQMLISRGQQVSRVLIERLKNHAAHTGICEPIRVFVPLNPEKGSPDGEE